MGLAIDTVGGVVTTTNVAGTKTNFTPSPGESFQPGSFPRTSPAFLEAIFAHFTATNELIVRGPSMHDNENAIHSMVLNGQLDDQLYGVPSEPILPQQNIQVVYNEITAVIAAAQTVALRFYYEDLDGASARLVSPGDVQGNIKHITTVKVTVARAGTAGDWASAAIDSLEDSLHSDSKYAVIGFHSDVAVNCVAVHGPDTSNYRVGAPGSTDRKFTSRAFWDESLRLGRPHIPVIDPKNRGATYVDVLDETVAGNVNVYLVLAEMPGT